MPVKIFKKFFKPKKLNVLLKIILFFNFITCLCLLLSYLAAHVNPQTNSYIPFFGLAYPYFLIGNFLFFIFWLVLRNKWIFLSLAVFLIGFNHFRHFFQITIWDGPKEENSEKIKVMSYNVRLFDWYNWTENKKTRNKIFQLLKEADADIYCFQEFYNRGADKRFQTQDTMVTFLRAKNIHEGFSHYIPNGEQRFGLATFSAYPIVKKELITFENDPNNCALSTDIDIKGKIIRVFNLHLSSIRFQKADYEYLGDEKNSKQWEKKKDPEQRIISRLNNAYIKRSKQVEIILSKIEQSPYPVLVCGDFNDTPVSYTYRKMTKELWDAFVESGNGTGSTYIGMFPFLRIDYILHSKELNAYQFETHSEELSDHHAISCIIELLEN